MAGYQSGSGVVLPFVRSAAKPKPSTVTGSYPAEALQIGIVESVGTWNYQIGFSGGLKMQTLVAASCLLEPKVHDQVLVMGLTREMGYVLAVLQQGDTTQQHLRFQGDVHLQSEAGSIHLQAKETLSTASQNWQAVHHSMEVTAYQGRVTVHQLKARFQQVRYAAERLTRMITHLVHRGSTEQRQLDQHYALRTAVHVETASGLRQSTAKVSIQRAEQISMTADKVMINS